MFRFSVINISKIMETMFRNVIGDELFHFIIRRIIRNKLVIP